MIGALIVLCAALATILLLIVLNNVVKISRSIREFKQKSNGLPLLEGASLISGHILGVVLKKNICQVITKYHKIHGKTIGWMYREKFGTSTIDLDLIRRMVLENPEKHINRLHIDLPMEYDEDSLMFARDEKWRRIRREIAPALTKQKLKTPNVIREIESSIKKLIEGIENRIEFAKRETNKPTAKVDIDNLAHRYSLDLVYGTLYKQYNIVDFNSQRDYHVDVVDSGLVAMQNSYLVSLGIIFPIFKPIVDWLAMKFHPQGKWREDVIKFIAAQTELNFEARKQLKKLAASQEDFDENNFLLEDGTKFKRNIMDSISDSYHDGRISRKEYFHSAFFLFNAADKTSADALGRTIYFLSINKRVQEKIRAAVLAEGVDSEYLGWVLNESMRLYPPAPVGCSRLTSCDVEVTKGGPVIPKDTFVITPLYTIHRWPEYWGDDADEFKPERWSKAKSFHPCQFMPFGAGIRSCLGKEFALLEMKMVLCALLVKFKFDGKEQPFRFDSPFLINLVHSDKPTYIEVSPI